MECGIISLCNGSLPWNVVSSLYVTDLFLAELLQQTQDLQDSLERQKAALEMELQACMDMVALTYDK